MNDRFKFRAKLKNINNWVYGAYLKMLPYQPNPVSHRKPLEIEYKHLIITEDSADWGMPRGIAAYEVISETVGQSTGLKDKNGKLIYEGDIIKTKYTTPEGIDMEEICTVNFDRCAFWINYGYCAFYLGNENCIYEVIGNIYENKDLLNA